MSSKSPFLIMLTPEQRATLVARAGAYTGLFYVVERAKIVLLASAGVENKEIAARVDTSPQVVHRWRKRFFEEGLDGLEDRKRSGRPATFSPSGDRRDQGVGV
jgi:hypothetical protein